MTPPPTMEKNIFQMTRKQREAEGVDSLPGSLEEAINLLKGDALAKTVLGEHVFWRFIEAKEKEWDDFRTKVTPWELESYLTKY